MNSRRWGESVTDWLIRVFIQAGLAQQAIRHVGLAPIVHHEYFREVQRMYNVKTQPQNLRFAGRPVVMDRLIGPLDIFLT